MRTPHPPIRLRTDGPDIVVELDMGISNKDGNSYVEVIREKVFPGEICHEICHEVLDAGIERAKERHYRAGNSGEEG